MIPKLLIISDDITGALDTGVKLAKADVATFVSPFEYVDFSELPGDIHVLVVNTESRHLSASEAASRVSKITQHAKNQGIQYFYKKTDSTLRGNVGIELEAVMQSTNANYLAFIPAYPDTNRTTRDGYQYVNRVPLHESHFGDDPLEPAITSYIPDILKKQTKISAKIIRINELHRTIDLNENKTQIFIFDCLNNEHLKNIGAYLFKLDLLKLTAGPAAFAGLLPDLLQLPQKKSAVDPAPGLSILVNGSVNPISLNQVVYAEKKGIPSMVLPAKILLDNKSEFKKNSRELVDKSVHLVRSKKYLIIRSIIERKELESYISKSPLSGLNVQEACKLTAQNLGYFASKIIGKAPVKNCIVFGGDTLNGLIDEMLIKGLLPKREIFPGIVLSELWGGSFKLNIISKAGGFGQKNLVLKLVQYLRG